VVTFGFICDFRKFVITFGFKYDFSKFVATFAFKYNFDMGDIGVNGRKCINLSKKRGCNVDWIRLAQNMVQWWAGMNTVINLLCHKTRVIY
jgi:hypothetical protein